MLSTGENVTIEAILATELENATGNTDLNQNLALALRYYDAETGPVPLGGSDLVSPDVRDAIESSVSEMMGAINGGADPLVVFDPLGPDDVQLAELETIATHRQVFGRNRGSIIMETAVRDAMLQRYCVARVDADDDSLEIYNVAPENFVWAPDLTSQFLTDTHFFAERYYKTRAQLREEGERYAMTAPVASPSDQATLNRYPENFGLATSGRKDDELIEVWKCWLRGNTDKGGWDCYDFVQPNLVLSHEWVEYQPYATGCTTLRPHRFDGVSVFDKLQQIQTAKTYLLRQLAIQAKLASQSRVAIKDRSVNPDDLVADQLNPVIRCKSEPMADLMVLPIQDVTSQLLATLQWLDGLRREDGGASIDQTTPQMQVAGQSAHAAERFFSVKELQTSLMLRTFGDTFVRSLYLLVHKALKLKFRGQLMVKNGDEYFEGDTLQFPDRTEVNVDIGAPLGTRQRRLSALREVMEAQQVVLQTGGAGILVTPVNIFNAQRDYAKLAGLPNSEKYWTNPQSPEAMQTAQQQALAAQAEKQRQQALEEASIKMPAHVEGIKTQGELAKQHMVGEQQRDKTEAEIELGYFDAITKAKIDGKKVDIQEAQLVLSAVQGAVETNREAATASE